MAAALAGSGAAGGGPKLPYDVVVLGEEHGNPVYHRKISESLPGLMKLGYDTFAVEIPEDVSDRVFAYISSKIRLDEEGARRALGGMLSRLRSQTLHGDGRDVGRGWEPRNFRHFSATLDLLTEASLSGWRILAVDMDTRGLFKLYRVAGRGDPSEEHDEAAAVFRAVGARNAFMSQKIRSGTVLLVGRGHTGESVYSVENLIRARGLSALSVDLVGADETEHGQRLDDADVAVEAAELDGKGGIVGVVAGAEAAARTRSGYSVRPKHCR